MSRSEMHELLPLYADGELDAARAAEVEDELGRSPELRAELARWTKLRQCCNRVTCCGGVPAGFEDHMRSGLYSQQRVIRLRQFFTYATLAAAAVIAAAIFWPRASSRSGQAPVQATLASAEPFVRIYERCAKNHHDALHLESSCPISATALVKKKLEEQNRECPVLVPDLRPDGYELQGICQCFPRQECPQGMNVVHAFYKRAATDEQPESILSVFSTSRCLKVKGCCGRDGPCKSRRQYESGQFDGVTLVKWDERGGCFALCAELPATTLENLAEKVRIAARMEAAPPIASAQP